MIGQPVGLGYRRTGSPRVGTNVIDPGGHSLTAQAKSSDVIDLGATGCRRRGWCWCSAWQDVALPASRCTARAVAEVLVEGGVVSLHAGGGAGVAISNRAVDHIEVSLPLVQSQLEVGTATP